MSAAATISQIDSATLTYAPQILAGVTAIETADMPGTSKAQVVTNIVLAGAQVAEGVPVPTVQGIGLLITLFVSILKANGLFKSKTP
jgi:flagellar biosynthesis protein FliQ